MRDPILLVASLAALAATAALAQAPEQTPPPPQPGAAVDTGADPSEMICRSQRVIGSRLSRQRVCATRQQWADQTRGDRALAEQAQTRRTWCKEGVAC